MFGALGSGLGWVWGDVRVNGWTGGGAGNGGMVVWVTTGNVVTLGAGAYPGRHWKDQQ
jgi:hypothetical protein